MFLFLLLGDSFFSEHCFDESFFPEHSIFGSSSSDMSVETVEAVLIELSIDSLPPLLAIMLTVDMNKIKEIEKQTSDK